MQAYNNSIEKFLGLPKTVFVVPVYQRNYDWREGNCKQLFQDIIRVIESKQEHFLGTICFKLYSSREKSIIDGQQRLTSISLMLKAIYDFDKDKNIRQEINDNYLYNTGRGADSDFMKFKLHMNKRDDVVYHILLSSTKEDVEGKLTSTQKKNRVYQNYLLFYELVSDYVGTGGATGDILDALSSLTIVELEIQQENPQEIFESLNSTGLDLKNVDLLRNYFLMQFDHETQTNLYEIYWSQIEDVIGVDNMEKFFVDFLVFRRLSSAILINGRWNQISERNLYIAFKDYYASLPYESDYDKTLNCFKDLKACSELYKEFIFTDDFNMYIESPIRRKLYLLFSSGESNISRCLLLYIFDLRLRGLIDDDVTNVAVDAIASMIFRAKICRTQRIISRQFAGNVMHRLSEITDYDKFEESFWQAITAGNGSYAFPSDEEFMEALVHKDLYRMLRARGTKYLLYSLENKSPRNKGLPPFEDPSISIEHIMPQTLNDQWKQYLSKETMESYGSSLHRLGNLALTNYNGEMSNKSFSEKIQIYKDSKFYYTTHISEYTEWQIAQIEDRSLKLAYEALRIWQLPAAYQKVKAKFNDLHTLDDDATQFTSTTPTLLIIGDKEYPIDSWSSMLLTICKHYDSENHEVFMEIANPERNSAFNIEDESHTLSNNSDFLHIGGDLFIRKIKSTLRILSMVKRITDEYDIAAGTDYFENILFR